mmetsp:Transcript_48834/g.112010  ORF Transcript_48834/g.112010 Transcript_48834/m.112010 type:complete len:225 (+) Transcript_48834:649-1323(+)
MATVSTRSSSVGERDSSIPLSSSHFRIQPPSGPAAMLNAPAVRSVTPPLASAPSREISPPTQISKPSAPPSCGQSGFCSPACVCALSRVGRGRVRTDTGTLGEPYRRGSFRSTRSNVGTACSCAEARFSACRSRRPVLRCPGRTFASSQRGLPKTRWGACPTSSNCVSSEGTRPAGSMASAPTSALSVAARAAAAVADGLEPAMTARARFCAGSTASSASDNNL